jgi:hypothetical protein
MDDFFEIDSATLSQIQSQINKYCLQELQKISNDSEKIFHDAIKTNVYDYYKPVWYKRTESLLNSVRSEVRKINNTYTLYIYVDTNLLNYTSAYDKNRNVSNIVPYWINEGHNARNYLPTDSNGEQFYNEFHAYEPRRFVEKALEELRLKYGGEDLIIEIDEESFSEGSW